MSPALQAVMGLGFAGWFAFGVAVLVARVWREAALHRGALLREALKGAEQSELQSERDRVRLGALSMEASRLRRELSRLSGAPPRAGVDA